MLSIEFFNERQKRIIESIKNNFSEYYSLLKINLIEQCFEEYNSDKDLSFSQSERMILMFYFWTFHAQKQKELLNKGPIRNKLRILLMDEPDAYLHPSLIKQIINMFLTK